MEQNSCRGGKRSPSPPKKKRGRPRKSETTPLSEKRSNGSRNTATPVSTAAVDRQAMAKPKPRVSQSDQNAAPSSEAKPLVGQSVHGMIDGSFDAGYLVTIRVGDTDTVYHGVVFGPGLSIPVNGDNDIAPKVRNTNRDDAVSSPVRSPSPTPPCPAVSTAANPLPTPSEPLTRDLPFFSVTPAPVEVGSSLAPAAFRSSFDQDTTGFMYPGLSQLHSGGGTGFFPGGSCYPYQLPAAAGVATEYASANAQLAVANAQEAVPRPRPSGS